MSDSNYAYTVAVATNTLYIFETWLDATDGKPRGRLSNDG